MTSLADIGALNMTGVLARRCRAVMTAGTIAGNTAMVKVGRYPGIGRMTGLAVSATLNMRGVFTGRYRSIVTTGTGANDISVIHPDDRHP